MIMVATAATTALIRLFGTGTAPDKNHRYRQHHCEENKLLPIHIANIAANLTHANGILYNPTFALETALKPQDNCAGKPMKAAE